MKKLLLTFTAMLSLACFALAQREVTGTITGDDGSTLIGATVLAKGTTVGTVTDVDGTYSLRVPEGATVLVISYTGFSPEEITLGASSVVDVSLKAGQMLDEVVVTALGITRYKNELPYSAQKVGGDDVTNVRDPNLVNTLSGRVAGLNVKRNNTLGGSTNVVLRGSKSLTGDNQALFVVDGVPLNNYNSNTSDQVRGRNGYDFGSPVNDINPDDVESVTVLKGAAATALYGTRAANGVVMITTKKGSKANGIGVSINSGVNFGKIDKSTFIDYQKNYGGGYGPYYEDASGFFLERDVNNDGTPDLVVPTSEDASWGARFDPNLQVYLWDAFDPTSPFFGKPHQWIAAENGPEDFFETAFGTSNNITIDGTNEKGYFKLGYTRATDRGILPNSEINKNLINFGSGFNLTSKLSVGATINYTSTEGLGRYGTGYDNKNPVTNFRQWWQINTDIKDQEAAYNRTKANITWNWADPTDLNPIYWDNVYFTRYESFESDHRNRYFGNINATYEITDWLSVTGRVSQDQYDDLQEERIAVGSVDVSQYVRTNRTFRENNYDLLAQVKQQNFGDNLKFDALIGGNIRRAEINSARSSTNGGLAVPGLYSLSNTQNSLRAPFELQEELEVDGVFGRAGIVYDEWAIVDVSLRRDQASTLSPDNNTFYYPSASLGIVFSKWLSDSKAVSFGKLRLNYAEVGNLAPFGYVNDEYDFNDPFGSVTLISSSLTKNNLDLKPERTKSYEGGLEMRFLDARVGFDVTLYKLNTVDQIVPATVPRTTGFDAKIINAGDVENRGVEVSVFLRPVKMEKFQWNIDLNWSANRSEVKDLGGIENLQLASLQGGVTINASLNEPYGTIRGSNFVYNEDGRRVVDDNGYYQFSATSDEIIGDVNPDWIGGIFNNFTFGNVSLGFLLDVKKGGDLFSLDRYYGMATGLPKETGGKNDLGNDLRLPIAEGGGIIFDGVNEDGSENTTRVETEFGIYGYVYNPAAAFVYDASYVKLREANLSFNIPSKMFGASQFIRGASLGIYGRNLWIIHKNLPDADPEDGISAGNVQGYQVGSYPTVRTFGVNLSLRF